MINILFNLSKLIYLSFCIRGNYDKRNLSLIKRYINNSGCLCIKCIQWLVPILENQNIDNKLLNCLSNSYENNYIHDIKYTEKIYYKLFNNNINDDYDIKDIIGSGSIGQIYKVKCKKTGNLFALKIKHPNIESQIKLLKYVFNLIYKLKIFNKFFHKYFPFNLVDFLDDFYKQTDFINESNNLLDFYHNYENNPYIIIPKLIKSSNELIIMEYIDGTCIDNMNLNEYDKSKIIFLLYLFIRNNMIIVNNNHGDLHKYNWKISDEKYNKINKIIIYDFGYCFKNNKKEYSYVKKICNLIQTYDKNNHIKVNEYKEFLQFLFDNDNIKININFNHNITKPDILLNQVLNLSKDNNLMIKRNKVLNILLLMCLVDNYFTKYNISNEPKIKVKNNLLNAYAFCKHYDIFEDLSNILLKEYKELGPSREIFETIQFNDKIKSLI